MEDAKNTVRREGNRVVKTFGSRLAYVKEASIYEKLKGTGLAPELLEKMDGMIEHEYIEGPTVEEALRAASGNLRALATIFSELCVWYQRFRETIKLTLGGVDFSKFILTDAGLCYIDFEHCKPGYMEEDIADILAELCFSAGGFSEPSLAIAQLFAEISRKKLEWIPELVQEYLPQYISAACARRGYEAGGSEIMEAVWAVTPQEEDR